jgi:hypothetical protein
VRALTLNGMVMAGGDDSAVRLELVAAWSDLPRETREDLVQNRWPSIAGPEMLPILRRMIAEPPPPARTAQAMTRDAVLQHLYELDPTEGRDAIRKDLLNDKAQPGLALIQLLPKEDIAAALRPAVERIGKRAARELDFDLVDRYADATVLEPMQSAFEAQAGQWGCASQSAMLRYFLRVAPEYGVTEVSAALGARKNTGCFRLLLSDLEAELPKAQPVAIGALDDADPEVAQSAAGALGLWGSADAEKQLWVRLEWFHKEWEGREEQLRATADRESAGSRAAVMEAVLVSAIARGTNWLCPPESLAKLSDLVWNKDQRQQIEAWRKQWNEGPAVIQTNWFPQDKPTFSILQYVGLTEEQLGAKLAQFRSGTELGWQFWQPGQISPLVSMVKQEAVYERMRAVAGQRGIILQKVNHP